MHIELIERNIDSLTVKVELDALLHIVERCPIVLTFAPYERIYCDAAFSVLTYSYYGRGCFDDVRTVFYGFLNYTFGK